jgi:hypothetical protein
MKAVGHADAEYLGRQAVKRKAEPLLVFIVQSNIESRPDAVVQSGSNCSDVVGEVRSWHNLAIGI